MVGVQLNCVGLWTEKERKRETENRRQRKRRERNREGWGEKRMREKGRRD